MIIDVHAHFYPRPYRERLIMHPMMAPGLEEMADVGMGVLFAFLVDGVLATAAARRRA